MAYVKQITIHNTLNKTLNYITNPEKTEGRLLVTGINCSGNPKLAYRQMKVTKNEYSKNGKVLGYHFMQSFEEGEIKDPKIAHEIGLKWAEKISKGKYEVVVSTHIDKGHVHNHFVLNSVSKETGEKYNSCTKQLREIRSISDDLCKEYNLSVIKPKRKELSAVKNMSYNVWMIKNNIEDSRKASMKYVGEIIDVIISKREVKNIDELAEKLKEFNIETRYKNKKGELYKNISFNVIGTEEKKGFRGRYNHSIENLIKRINDPSIDENRLNKNKWQKYASENYPNANYKKFIKQSIDNIIASGKCNNIDDLAEKLKSEYNITMDYLTADLRVKKRIKFFANDCPYEKYAVGSYGLAGKEQSELYENDGIYERIENAKLNKTVTNKEENSDPTLVKFTGKLIDDLELLKSYFEYSGDVRKSTVERCLMCLEKAEITDVNRLISLSNSNALLANKEIDEKNEIVDRIKVIEEKEKRIEKLDERIDSIKIRINNLSNEFGGKIKNRKDIDSYKEKIKEFEKDKVNLMKELKGTDKFALIDKQTDLEATIESRRHLQENFKDTIDLFNNREALTKESSKENKIKQADRIIKEIKKRNELE